MAGRAAGPVVAVAKVAQTASIVHNAQERAKNAPTTEGAAARGMTEIAGNLAQVSSVPVWVASEIESRYLPKAKPISGALSAGVETVGIVGDALSDTKQAERSTFGLASDLEKGKYGTYMQAVAAFGEKHSAWTADLVGDLAFVFTAGDVSSLRE